MESHDHHHHHDHNHDHHYHPQAGQDWLILDVGAGTQDILIYQPTKPLAASYKMVLPSPSHVAGAKVDAAAGIGRDVWLYGRVMGGGELTEAVKRHIAGGLKVYAQKEAALSIHDSLKKVESMGVVISQDKPAETTPVACGDVDLHSLGHALDHFGLGLPSRFAAAAQDHGFTPEGSNRDARFKMWEDSLRSGGDPAELVYLDPPPSLTRLAALAQSLPGAVVADSATAALLGALQDETAARARDEGLLVVNVGNGHTVAFLVKDQRVAGVYEHHTSLLNESLLAEHLNLFRQGKLDHQEVVSTNGHGVLVIEPIEAAGAIVTGPKRDLAKHLGRMAVPHGDMMLTGCFGLVEAARLKGLLT